MTLYYVYIKSVHSFCEMNIENLGVAYNIIEMRLVNLSL